jgi:hypothetical protein
MAGPFASVSGKPIGGVDDALGRLTTNIAPSSSSGNSSDTFQGNESSHDHRERSNISPLSTATLNFDDLKIQNDDFPYPKGGVNRFASSFQHSVGHYHSPSPAYGSPVHHFHRSSFQSGPGNGYQTGGGSPRNTRTWVSEDARAAHEFLIIRNSMKRLFKNSEVAKWKVADYIAHREATRVSAVKKLARQAQDKEDTLSLHIPPISPQQQDMMQRCGLTGNFDQVGNYGRILGEKTIWCKDWQNGKDEIAPWPCMAEFKWEGDDRAKTGVGRYPPLPREQGPDGLPWNQLQAVDQYPLDQIARIPTMEDVYLPVDEIDEEVKYNLVNKELEDAMDKYLDS